MSNWIEITTKIGCRSQCEYCPQSKLVKSYVKRSRDVMMSFDTFKKCISSVPKEIEIHFTGFCEPFENPQAIDFMEYAIKQWHGILVNTTLKGVTRTTVDRLVNLFENKIMTTSINIHLPSTEYTSHIVDEYYLDILEYILINLQNINFHIHGTPITEVDKLIKSYRGEYRKKVMKIHSRAGNVEFKDISNLPKKYNCPRIYSHVILPNGDVVLCCVDYGLEVILGNLTTMTYEELHLTDKFKEIEKSGSILCSRCEF